MIGVTYVARIIDGVNEEEDLEVGQVSFIKKFNEADIELGTGLIDSSFLAKVVRPKRKEDCTGAKVFGFVLLHWYEDGKYYKQRGELVLTLHTNMITKFAFTSGVLRLEGEREEGAPFRTLQETGEVLPQRPIATPLFY